MRYEMNSWTYDEQTLTLIHITVPQRRKHERYVLGRNNDYLRVDYVDRL